MAILVKSKNRSISVDQDYFLQVGKKIFKKATQYNLEATQKNLMLSSGKKVVTQGGM